MPVCSYLNRTAFLTCVGIAVAFLTSEIVLRETRFRGYAPALALARGYHIPRADTLYDIAPNYPTTTHYAIGFSYSVWSNSHGCFDAPFTAGEPYVYLTGDSFAWGFAPFEDKWGTQLERWLGIRIAKCGVVGFGTGQELVKAARAIEQMGNPKLIIVNYYANDISDDAWFAERQRDGAMPSPAAINRRFCIRGAFWIIPMRVSCWLERHSILYNLVRRLVPAAPQTDTFTSSDIAANEANLLAFRALAQNHGANLLFVLTPRRAEVASAATTSPSWDRVRSFLAQHNIAYLDLFPFLQALSSSGRMALYWPEDVHLNVAGNHLAGALVAEYLLRNDLVRIENKEAVLSAIRGTIARLKQ